MQFQSQSETETIGEKWTISPDCTTSAQSFKDHLPQVRTQKKARRAFVTNGVGHPASAFRDRLGAFRRARLEWCAARLFVFALVECYSRTLLSLEFTCSQTFETFVRRISLSFGCNRYCVALFFLPITFLTAWMMAGGSMWYLARIWSGAPDSAKVS